MTQETKPAIVDARGVPIARLSIVGMSDQDGQWLPHQGLVVEPHSTLESDGYCVAVYFYQEVRASHFYVGNRRGTVGIDTWDRRYDKNDKMSETEFLFTDNAWTRSPRVIFFRPEELLVTPSWDIVALAKRMFKNSHHSAVLPSEKLPRDPTAYICWMVGCQNQATDIALYNFWGSVYPFFVCKACLPKVNGMCGESLPPTKNPLLAADGNPINVPI